MPMEKTMAPGQSAAFGVVDYWRMLKAKGIRLPVTYFLQAHLFDLLHGTDTHRPMAPDAQDDTQPDGQVPYRCSWTREIKVAFETLRRMLGAEFEQYNFIDIGCGKGKVIMVWAMLLNRFGMTQRLTGIDCCEAYVKTAWHNQRILGLPNRALFIHGDATKVDYAGFGAKLIVYLYNPFNEAVLRKLLPRLDSVHPVIVYNNPVHANAIRAAGYRMIWEKRGWHPNARMMILRKSKA